MMKLEYLVEVTRMLFERYHKPHDVTVQPNFLREVPADVDISLINFKRYTGLHL